MSQTAKEKIRAEIIGKLEKDLALLVSAARTAREEATHEESKAEDKYDTRGLEASYLAGAQAKRAAEIQDLIVFYLNLTLRDFNSTDDIASSALVEIENEVSEKKSWIFLVPKGAAMQVESGGLKIQVLTALSPLGESLLGKHLGDSFSVQTPSGRQDYSILSLS